MGRNYDHGVALFRLQRYREAVDAFTEELNDQPQSGLAFAMRAASWLNHGKIHDAYRDVCEALRVEPDLGYAHYILSCVRTKQGHSRQAETAVREALRIERRPVYFFRLAEIYFLRKLYEDSLGITEEGLAVEPSHVDCLMLRAKCLSALGRQSEAKDCLRVVLSHNPEDPAAHQALGRIRLATGRTAEARDSLREARRLNPNEHNDRNALAAAYGRLVWPLRVCDRFLIRFEHWPPSRRWVLLATTATSLLAVSCVFNSHFYIALPFFLIAFNMIAASVTFGMFAIAIGKVFFRRDLDIRWYSLLPQLLHIGFPIFFHLFISGMAVACADEPFIGALILGFGVNFELILVFLRSRAIKQVALALLAVLFVFIPITLTCGLLESQSYPAAALCWLVSLGFSYLLTVYWR